MTLAYGHSTTFGVTKMVQNFHSNFVHKVSAVALTLLLAHPSTRVLLVGRELYVGHVLKVTNRALSLPTVYQRVINVM